MSRPRATILVYHAIGECPGPDPVAHMLVSLERFESHLGHLLRRARLMSLANALDPPDGDRPAVAITFDDAYRSIIPALQLLERAEAPATIFVPTGHLGGRNSWDESTCPLEIMSADEIAELHRRGFDIESHGHEHIDLSKAERGKVQSDLRLSIETLTAIVGRRPRFLAFPWGRASPSALAQARRTGFEATFGVAVAEPSAHLVDRVQVEPTDGRMRLALKASGRWAALRRSPVGRLVHPPVRRETSS